MDGRVFVQFTQHQLMIGTTITRTENIIFASRDEFKPVCLGLGSAEIRERLGLVGTQTISFRVIVDPEAISRISWRNF